MPEGMPDKVPECLPEHMPEDLPDRMSEDMPEDMPDRVPEDMPENMPENMPGRMPEDMPDRMPEDMPDKMPEDMSDRMPEDLPVTKRIDVMVGITRSKVFFPSWGELKNLFPQSNALGLPYVTYSASSLHYRQRRTNQQPGPRDREVQGSWAALGCWWKLQHLGTIETCFLSVSHLLFINP